MLPSEFIFHDMVSWVLQIPCLVAGLKFQHPGSRIVKLYYHQPDGMMIPLNSCAHNCESLALPASAQGHGDHKAYFIIDLVRVLLSPSSQMAADKPNSSDARFLVFPLHSLINFPKAQVLPQSQFKNL